jgi:MFS superfamily sulfate permease-like transporter
MQISGGGGVHCSPSVPQKPAWPYQILPLLHTVRTYGSRDLLIDLPTGITQAVLHIPQGMAYALLAGVEPIYGLYVSFIPPLIYALFSTTKHVSIGK